MENKQDLIARREELGT